MTILTRSFCFLLLIPIVHSLTAGFQRNQAGTPSRVLMYLSAHPDDEDGATLSYYAHRKGVKTYSLFFTRGEGGQNEIGTELNGELGALRTRETLNAGKILGSEVYFLGFDDFGYSRTARETFARWGGQDSVLARLVYFIRALKPDVILTTHDTTTTKPNRQHGNHQAVGISTFDAFRKAADPSFHPEQLRNGLTTWQPKKLFFRYLPRDIGTGKGAVVTLDTRQGSRNDMTFDSLMLQALRAHHSQGMGKWTLDSIPPYYRLHRYYLVEQSEQFRFDSADVFSGIAPSERNIAGVKSYEVPASAYAKAGNPADVQAIVSPNLTIGLVETYDNTIRSVLKAFHIPFTLIDSATLATGNLALYSSLILDLRAYLFRYDLERYNERILEYARNGGNVICFYHKTGDWNGKSAAPYTITLGSDRVTEEDARVTILDPKHPFFNLPNRIDSPDWDGWVQERSIYLPIDDTTKTSARYSRLLSMTDTDEQEPPTSLLWTEYGHGTYTYCSLTLYRQLRIFHNGATKLFFNMISQRRH